MTSSTTTGGADEGGHDAGHPLGAEDMAQDVFVFPLTPQQRGLWRIDRAHPGRSNYNGAFLFEIAGPVRPQLIEKAFGALIQRHEILRASVREIDGEPRLVIAPNVAVKFSVSDLRLLSPAMAEARAAELTQVEAHTPFDITRPPLIRLGLIRITDTRAILMMTIHHVVCDGWTLGALAREGVANYERLAAGSGLDMTPPPLQFGDYATWLEEELSQPPLQAQLSFWRGTLANYRRFDVPGDIENSGLDETQSDIVGRAVPDTLIERFQTAANASGGTLFTATLAALAIVLATAAARDDVSLGVPVAGRDQPELEPVVGPLINYLVLSAATEPGITFRDLERRIREQSFDAFANQTVPLETVAASLMSDGREIPDPFYSVCFVTQTAFGKDDPACKFADCQLQTLPSVSPGSIYDLFFFLVKRETGYRLSVDYRTSRFSRNRANEFLVALEAIMEQVADDPGKTVRDLAPLHLAPPSATRRPDMTDNAPAASKEQAAEEAYVLPASVVQERYWLLSKADPASTAHHVPACVRITGQLDAESLARAVQLLADRHEALGTVFQSVDGVLQQVISADRKLELDHTDLTHLSAQDAEAKLREAMLAEAAKPFDLEEGPLVRMRLYKLADREHLLAQTYHHIICDGQSIAILQREMWRAYEADRTNQPHGLPPLELQYGDVAANELELLAGEDAAAQFDFWKKTLASPLPVLDFPLEHAPTNRAATTTAIELMPVAPELVTRLKQLARTAGTTMFVITSAAYAALLARFGNGTDVLFGCPVANRSAETAGVCGPFAGPMAIRLDLSGDPTLSEVLSRAREYSLDALSAADVPFDRIVSMVDARSVGGRNPLFQFYFVYQQAFLQGQQVAGLEITPVPTFATGTPFELQIVLIERESQVTAQVDYNPELLSESTVRSILSYYTGILDRLASAGGTVRLSDLPEPQFGTAKRLGTQRVETAYAAPRTPTEIRLAEIWQELLKRGPIGVHDDFFDLGGQSILAARMVLAVERAFNAKIQVSTVARARTIEQMARIIEDPEAASARLIPMRTAGTKTPLFLIHCGGGHVLRYEDLVGLLEKDQPVYGVSAPPIEPDDRSTTVESLATLYLDDIRKVQPRGPYRIAGYSFGGLVAYEMARQLSLAGERVSLLAILDTMNRLHYRGLPVAEKARMAATYIHDRGSRHLARLRNKGFKAFAEEAAGAVQRKLRPLVTRLSRHRAVAPAGAVASTAGNEPLPVNHNLTIFAELAARYRPKPYAGRVLVVHAEDRGLEYRKNPTLGWEDLSAFGADVVFVPGDHMSFMRKPHVERLAEELTSRLGDSNSTVSANAQRDGDTADGSAPRDSMAPEGKA